MATPRTRPTFSSQVKQGRSKGGAFAPKAKVTSQGVTTNRKGQRMRAKRSGLKFTMRTGKPGGPKVGRSPGVAGVRDKKGRIVSNAKPGRAKGAGFGIKGKSGKAVGRGNR